MKRENWLGFAIAGGAFLVVVLIFFALFNIEPPLKEGKVIDRRFTPEHWEDGYRTEHYDDCGLHMTLDGEMEWGCKDATRQVYESHHRWVSDDWDIRLRACSTNDKGDEKCRSSWIDVGRDVYNQCTLGRYYRESDICALR